MYCIKLIDILEKYSFGRYTFMFLDGDVKSLDCMSYSKDLTQFFDWYVVSFQQYGENIFIKLFEPFDDDNFV